MAGTLAATRLTYQDYLNLPETATRYDILDGELVMSPTPTGEHNWIADTITALLNGYARPRALGIAVSAPWDVLVQRDPLRTRQPDVVFVSTGRTGIRSRQDLRGIHLLEAPPDLVVEIASASNTFGEVLAKLQDCRSIGVQDGWLVRPEEETVEVLDLAGASVQTIGKFAMGGRIQSAVLPELDLSVDEVFA